MGLNLDLSVFSGFNLLEIIFNFVMFCFIMKQLVKYKGVTHVVNHKELSLIRSPSKNIWIVF